MKQEIKDILKILAFLIITLGGLILLACNGNYSIGGYDISPSDSVSADFIIIIDQDSVQHWYMKNNFEDFLTQEHYCYKHNQWEQVKKKI